MDQKSGLSRNADRAVRVALIFAFDWLLILIVPTWVILNLAVVRHEELYLQQRFGKAYLDYTKRTPRYFFIH